MVQTVAVTRVADRHEDLHRRHFAETEVVAVPAGPVATVVSAALDELAMPEGKYVITVDWPHEAVDHATPPASVSVPLGSKGERSA